MIRLLLVIAVALGAIYLVRWFLNTPAETVAATIRKSLWLLLGLGLIFLAVTGKLNIIFAFIGSAIPLIAKQLPNILRLLGVAKLIKSTKSKAQGNTPPPSAQAMNQQQALTMLGLKPGASRKDIIAAHKRLMQKVHPDKGGSETLASQINQAKNLLLKEYEP
ncbi:MULTISPECIES: DnaJ domain-containing protein [Cycloclasticus]|jgi:hypothetical protein|uniref:Molecular chaperone DnaJ n=1 Tax=Cycloclasticus zancles 78-ME TaxID=1198232 RepID=S5TAX9_9GAMM|nr:MULTISPECIES: DnaJ domain-containing protein [Cycloclasticus]AGS40734.1 Molecular chaperone DnaJ [Cycloclasticus zancles 78-ME]MBV1898463.1 aconitate hydratase [Cycloclasticus sp.]MDF1829834.1 aconitate hydratase [Cycloclasticus pugetii]SHJ15926.1 hypothetical protein SAMN05519226_1534 [Cycloclasticus pugetii]